MSARRRVSIVAIGALIGALLVPMAGAGAATAATLAPSGLQTGFAIDGDKTGGTPPNTFDWDSILTAPVPDGSYTFTPTGPYTTAGGLPSTGILDATFSWDNGSLAGACAETGLDATGAPGSQTPNTIPWAPGPADTGDRGDLCSTGSAYEVVTDAQGQSHAILYAYWTRLVGNGTLSVLQNLEGVVAGRCDDFLVVFDYESNLGTMTVHFRRWSPSANDECANPNGPGEWLDTGETVDFAWAVGVRTEGPLPVGNQPQATFGELGVDLTTAGLFDPAVCSNFAVSTQLSRTGSSFGAQTQDYLNVEDPLTISNCGALTVTKEVVAPGFDSDDRFAYRVDRASGGMILPDTGATAIVDDLGIDETDTFQNVLAASDYRLSETVTSPWVQESIVCTATQPGTGASVEFVLASPTDPFTVYPEMQTDCVITNTISTVTVTKQTLPDGSPQEFSFDIGGNSATLTDGQSATFAFTPGSTIDISEVIPEGWMGEPDITCTDPDAVISEADALAEVTTIAGQDVSCTFTNTQLSTIVISKEAFGTPPNSVFDFTGTWTTGLPELPAGGGFSIDAETGDGTNYTQTFTEVAPGSYSVAEPAGQHGTLLGSLICTIGGDDVIFEDTATAAFNLAPGDTVTCYYVNTVPGQILVVKESDPFEYDEDFAFQFGPSGAQVTEEFTLNPLPGQATWDSPPLEGGRYDITEDLGDLPNWTLTNITCDVSDGGTSTVDLETLTATVELPAAGIAQCVFNNTAEPVSLRLEKTTTGIADDVPWAFDFLLTDLQSGDARTITLTSDAPSIEVTDIAPGVEYSLVEVPKPGWTSTLDCNVVDNRGTAEDGWQFTLEPGTSFVCTAENTAVPASVSVTKAVTGVTSDYEWSFPFALTPSDGVTPAGGVQTISGTGPGSQTTSWTRLLPGETYTLTEQAAPGWVQGTLACTGVDDANSDPAAVTFVAQPGVAVACAIENAPEPVDITITKTALGGDSTFQYVLTPIDPAGEAIISSVATENGTGIATFTGLTPGGLYSLSELDVLGWIEGELVCTVAHADGDTADLDVTGFRPEPGDQITCGIENAAVGRIVIVKNVEGDDAVFDFAGTWPGSADFSIETSEGSGVATFTDVAPGDYEVTEASPDGYQNTALVCEDSDPQGGASTVDGLVGSIVLDPGEIVECTFTNIQLGTIVISKEAFGTPDDTPFEFVGDWPGLPLDGGFSINTETGDGENYTETFTDIAPGNYSVTEPPNQHGTLLASLICTIGGEDVVFEGPTADFDLAPGDTVTCYYANVTPGQILVIKSTDPLEYDQDFDFTFEEPAGTTTPFTLNPLPGQATIAFDDLFGGEHVITEAPLANWTLTDISCTGVDFTPDLAAGTATVTLPSGGAGSCTFTNTAAPGSVTVDKTVVGSTADYDWSFGFTLDPADGVTPGASQDITGTGSSTESATWDGLIPGETYTLTENVALGWEVGDLTCEGLIDTNTAPRSVTFVAAPGLDLTCAITNTAAPASVTVDKSVDGVTDEYAWSFGFALDPAEGVTPGASQDITGSGPSTESATWDGLIPGETYTLTEEAINGWEAGALTCTRLTDLDGTLDASVTFVAAPGLELTCAITNTAESASVTVDKTVDGVTDDFAWSFGFTLDPADGVTPGASQDITGIGPSTESATWDGLIAGQTYTLTEELVDEWVAGTLTCEDITDLDDVDESVTFVAAPGLEPTCAITNTAVPASVTVDKTVEGVSDDYVWSFGFTLDPADGVTPGASQDITGTGPSTESATWSALIPGETYTLAEDAALGWDVGDLTCTGLTDLDDTLDESVTFVAAPGLELTCAITNTAEPANVTVAKTVVGVAADYDWSFGFTLDPADGVTPGASQDITGIGPSTESATWEGLIPGETYTLTEEAIDGWVVGELTCQGITDINAAPESVAFVAAPGLELTCAITNTAAPVGLDVTKTALGGDDTFQFVLTPIDPAGDSQVVSTNTEGGTGVATFTGLVAGGTYSITESDSPDWIEGELTCTTTHADDSSEPIDIAGFIVEPGDSIACEVTNEAVGTIVIVKNVDGEDGVFDFTGTWLDEADFSISTTDGTGASTFEDVLAGAYTVEEVAPVGYDNTRLICTDGDPLGDASSSEGLVGQIALDPGETVICTFTNTQWGTILVDKTTLPAGSEQEFEFAWGTDDIAFTLTDEAEAYSTGLVAPGAYTISETGDIDGWTLTDITCTGADGEPVVAGSSVSVQVPLQSTVLCEFTNALQAPLLFDKALVGSPQKLSDGSYVVDYEITVENPGGLADVYDLDDRLQFGAGITVDSATVVSLNGVATDPTWNGIDAVRVATDVPIPAGVVHTYTVTARATLPGALAIDVADCTAAPGEGTGLLNTATVTYTDGQADASACAPVPASLPPTGAMVVGLWLGLGLLLGGAVLFLLRRRNRMV